MSGNNPLRSLDSFELLKLGKASVTVGGLAAGLLIVVAALFAARLTSAGLRKLREKAAGDAPRSTSSRRSRPMAWWSSAPWRACRPWAWT
jgi:small-conductance mechanosensitive channel